MLQGRHRQQEVVGYCGGSAALFLKYGRVAGKGRGRVAGRREKGRWQGAEESVLQVGGESR